MFCPGTAKSVKAARNSAKERARATASIAVNSSLVPCPVQRSATSLASRDLRALVDAGLLVPHGERRGRHYVAGEWLVQARNATRAKKVTTDPFTDEVIEVLPEDRQARLPI